MCGIGGVLMFPRKRDSFELGIIRDLVSCIAIANQARGRDATGVAVMNRKQPYVLKDAVSAKEFTNTPVYEYFMEKHLNNATKNVLIHTRAATKGSEKEQANNHPIVTSRTIGVHNGMIFNDDELFIDEKLFRQAQVDSEVIFRLADKYGYDETGAKTVAEKLSGSFTTAFVPKDESHKLILIKGSNPAYLTYVPKLNIILFASSDAYVKDSIEFVEGAYELSLSEGLVSVTPEGNSILFFDTNQDTAVEQMQADGLKFKSSYGYGSRYSDWDDWYAYQGYSREEAEAYGWVLPKKKEETTGDKLEKLLFEVNESLASEIRSLFIAFGESYWDQGFTAGRESMDEEVTSKSDTSFDTGYDQGYVAGYNRGVESMSDKTDSFASEEEAVSDRSY